MVGIPHVPHELYNTTAAVKRATPEIGELGEVRLSYTDGGEWPARLHRVRYAGSPSAWAEQGIVDLPSHKLLCPPATPVAPGDQVVIDGETFTVLEVFTPGGLSTHHKEVWLRAR